MHLLSNLDISLLGTYSRVKKAYQHKDLSTNVYSSFIFNRQKLETAQWNYYSAMKTNELVIDIIAYISTQNNYTESEKPKKIQHLLYDSSYIKL